jgi:hypothetical protein
MIAARDLRIGQSRLPGCLLSEGKVDEHAQALCYEPEHLIADGADVNAFDIREKDGTAVEDIAGTRLRLVVICYETRWRDLTIQPILFFRQCAHAACMRW